MNIWPNESDDYRAKRAELLAKEAQLRALDEEVAALRRALPAGGHLKENYSLIRVSDGKRHNFTDLFSRGNDTLITYSLMQAPGEAPCPMCTAMLDGLENTVLHLQQRANLAVLAKAPPSELEAHAKARDWKRLPLYSSNGTNFNIDYRAEDESGSQFPMLHVWRKRGEHVHHFWASELFFHSDPNWKGHPRHADPVWALWNFLDLTPEGRENWFPSLDYDKE